MFITLKAFFLHVVAIVALTFFVIKAHLAVFIQPFLPIKIAPQFLEGIIEHELPMTVSYYGDPKISVDRKQQTVEVRGHYNSAGLMFLKDQLNPKKRYELVMDGLNLKGTASVHFEQNGIPVWISAMSGITRETFSGVKTIKWLVYSDRPFRYQIKQLSLQECPKCQTDQDLKRRILRENPGLKNLLKTNQLQAAKEILNWTANHIIFSLGSEHLLIATINSSAVDASYYFDKKLGAVGSEASADYLVKIYHLFKIPAFAIEAELPRTAFKYSTTVVMHKYHHIPNYYIFDPTLNLVFLEKQSHRLASIDQLLKALRNENFNRSIIAQEKSMPYRYYVLSLDNSVHNKLAMQKTIVQGKNVFFRSKENFYLYYLSAIQDYEKKQFKNQNVIVSNSFIAELIQKGLLSVHGEGKSTSAEENNFMRRYQRG